MIEWLPYALVVYLVLVGLYGIVTSRNLVHLTLCLSVVQSGTYVLLLVAGFRDSAAVPIADDTAGHPEFVDPLMQTLAVTDIVVGATVTALLLALTIQIQKRRGTIDPNRLTAQRG